MSKRLRDFDYYEKEDAPAEELVLKSDVDSIIDEIDSDVNNLLRMFDCNAIQFDIYDVYSALDDLLNKL